MTKKNITVYDHPKGFEVKVGEIYRSTCSLLTEEDKVQLRKSYEDYEIEEILSREGNYDYLIKITRIEIEKIEDEERKYYDHDFEYREKVYYTILSKVDTSENNDLDSYFENNSFIYLTLRPF